MSSEEIKRIIGELDLHRLQKKLVRAGFGPVPVAIGDLFACGCFFISQGRKNLGLKLCRTALSAYEVEATLIERIISRIENDGSEISLLLNPHMEVPGWLFNGEED